MDFIDNTATLRRILQSQCQSGARIGLVPTMGNLHAGHLRLIEAARESCSYVLSTIFVNPMQFGPQEDFERYPRTLEADMAQLRAAGCNGLFAPDVATMYPDGLNQQSRVSVPSLSDLHCGASRPGHFDGVATVVCKLFNLTQPDAAFFGLKDYQQVLVIRKMTRDLCMPVEIVPIATVREASGLAMSSRNGYLNPEQKTTAAGLYATLCWASDKLRAGTPIPQTEAAASDRLRDLGMQVDYFHICNAHNLAPAAAGDRELVLLAAVFIGGTRLIDNLTLDLPAQS